MELINKYYEVNFITNPSSFYFRHPDFGQPARVWTLHRRQIVRRQSRPLFRRLRQTVFQQKARRYRMVFGAHPLGRLCQNGRYA